MTFLDTPDESPIYGPMREKFGYVPNYAKVFAAAPAAYEAWVALGAAIRAGMDERRYELVTVVAAHRLGSAYCTLAHAATLRDRFGFDDERLLVLLEDPASADLDAADAAAVAFAAKVAADPGAATRDDIERLRAHGLSEVDIVRTVLAVAARRFFAGVLDMTGAEPDAGLPSLSPGRHS